MTISQWYKSDKVNDKPKVKRTLTIDKQLNTKK